MNSITKLFKVETINSREVTVEFIRALWHLRSLLGTLLMAFFALCAAMFWLGAPVETATHARVSFGATVYYCGVTALTIGYGDVVATTGIGRALSMLLGLYGVLVTGTTTAVAVFAVQRAVKRDPRHAP
ncbi:MULTISPECIES: potassium channel family protein [Caballeronia]|jgi:voltage-gated potassium channel|uniref:Ion transporter n=1 Tax=Caballeronia zhejiangensis TaxID=871203 RepID=A0A656QJW6_9BURK|nr:MULTISPECIES: potassium channel family protein [Caballeronia]EKS69422.1 Ion transport 2 domain-containing protein [Burkholderia sp. SJ98]KDR29708.1 ion transporter [Caballeronia zhejiangensis]MDR5767012.1 potassium channel family protein [Caballeronia sp. LZ028]MDR5791103.1 potassium channel family protein [Caballeronia sp. LP003]